MQKVLALLSIVLATVRSQNVPNCENIRPAHYTFKPECDNNVQLASGLKMPIYEDVTSYYKCAGLNLLEIVKCDDANFPLFCYVLQSCVDCQNYIPAVECSDLPKEIASQCTPINGTIPGSTTTPSGTDSTPTTLPTPRYPSESTPSSQTTTTTLKPTATTPSSNITTTTTAPGNSTAPPTNPTPPIIDGSTTPPPNSTDIPPPPSPTTQNTLIPLPPTPPPTPPNVSVDPPYVSPKPSL